MKFLKEAIRDRCIPLLSARKLSVLSKRSKAFNGQHLCQSYERNEQRRERERREVSCIRSGEIGKHAREDGSRSEKGTTRVKLFLYVSSGLWEVDRGCRSGGFRMAE